MHETTASSPVIKGIFLKSHVNAVAKVKGKEGLAELERLFGKPLLFKNSDEVLVRDEVKLIECAVQVLFGLSADDPKLAYEAGKLHFKNFQTTPLGKLLLPFFQTSFKTVMMQTKNLAGHVFRGVQFWSEDAGAKAVTITMANVDYPLDHFKGFFDAWMDYCGIQGSIEATEVGPRTYRYHATWK